MEQLNLFARASELANQELVEQEDRRIHLQAINEQVKTCTKCRLHKTRTNTVFGEGNIRADVVFVGEGPGETEDQTGRPFVGRAGKLLDNMIQSIGLKREDVYIANVVKCRPPGNRVPDVFESEECIPYLLNQIGILKPKVVVVLGNTALGAVTGKGSGITKRCGEWEKMPGGVGIKVMPCFHPSALLRNPKWKEPAWNALQKVAEEIR